MPIKFKREAQPLLDYIGDHEMYRQAAAGNPFFITVLFDGAVEIIKPSTTIGYFKDEEVSFLINKADMVKQADQVISQISSPDSSPIEPLYKIRQQSIAERQEFIDKLLAINLNDLTFKELLDSLQEYSHLDIISWQQAYIIDCFDPTGEQIMHDEVLSNHPEITPEQLTDLLSHTKLSSQQLLEQQTLQLLVEDNKQATQILRDQFHWITNDYTGAIDLTVEYFDDYISKTLSQYPSLKDQTAKLADLNSFEHAAKTTKQAIMNELNFSDREQGIINVFTELTDWREERKRETQIGDWVFQLYLNEIARQKDIDPKLVTQADPREIDLFQSDHLEQVLQQRLKNGLIYATDTTADDYYIVDDPGSLEEFASAHAKLFSTDASKISGNIAMTGQVTGIVKVVNRKQDFDKFNQGDILVSAMTRPELMPVIRKAAGIITDEGGITCHAALVSREMGIPCVIATENATMLLKDGDKVLLDADNGVIKIVD